jgi:hypothetical protein
MSTEFQQLIDACKRSGIQHFIHWSPAMGGTRDTEERRDTFQKILKGLGFNITALSTNAVVLNDWYYVYSCSEPHWTTYQDDEEDMNGHKGWGQAGMFMFAWNKVTGKVRPRCVYAKDTHNVVATGLEALEATHGPFPKFTPRGS